MKKFEVHVRVEHWMYVDAENKEQAKKIAQNAVEWNSDSVSDEGGITEDEIEQCYAVLCEEHEDI